MQHVLFVGNSYVYYNNLPELVEAIAFELSGPLLEAEAHTHGGFTLQAHLDDGHIAELLRTGDQNGNPWGTVILQEQSSLGTRGRSGVLSEPREFYAAVREMDVLIDSAGAEPQLYMTWAKEWMPGQTEVLARAYIEAGKMIGASVAPVGLAWARVKSERPDLELYRRDGSHPTGIGSYLAACVIYSQLTGRTSEGAPAVIYGTPWDGPSPVNGPEAEAVERRTTSLVTLDAEVAGYLQQVAWEVVKGSRRD